MNALFTFIIVLQVVSALVIIGLVLIQHGKGADMGAAFGSGASGSLFGATGSSNFLSKFTGVAAAVFFSATLALALIGNKYGASNTGVMDRLPASTVPAAPAAGSSAPAAGAPAANAPVPANVAPSTPAPAPASPAAGGQANQIPK
ncbi:preprotein translocase subunit SecG [Noviherbaspirillum sp.]|uniref:preprotein translocase subunit SecG n=1 Tax=Noviherbaspirillum sp. TaxID=1926288 RepID=UPI002FE3A767